MPRRKVISPVPAAAAAAEEDEVIEVDAEAIAEAVGAPFNVSEWLKNEKTTLEVVEVLERQNRKENESKYCIVFVHGEDRFTINSKGVTSRVLRKFASNNGVLNEDGTSMRHNKNHEMEGLL